MLNARVRYISKEHVPQQKEIVRNEVKKTTKVALSRIQVQSSGQWKEETVTRNHMNFSL